tara:strand:+ start:93 stop:488 length:396 start_codon:yes stop_codon:yes gene_type:complete
MARFDNSREGRNNRGPKREFNNRDSGGRNNSRDRNGRGRDSGRDPSKFNRNNRDVQMTKVTCASCGNNCEVPFKPTSNRPVYCSDCFSKDGNSKDNKSSNRNFTSSNDYKKDFKMLNEKLDKIIKSLEAKE